MINNTQLPQVDSPIENLLITKGIDPALDSLTEVSIEEIIQCIKEGIKTDIVFINSSARKTSNVIVIICEGKYCQDVREVKPVLTTHSNNQLWIRSHDKDDVITSWKEYYIHAPTMFIHFSVSDPSETEQTEG
tara:strand:- start:483 stop:881 length:399 start_codon:yes stop_codon:yes gene_type:complete